MGIHTETLTRLLALASCCRTFIRKSTGFTCWFIRFGNLPKYCICIWISHSLALSSCLPNKQLPLRFEKSAKVRCIAIIQLTILRFDEKKQVRWKEKEKENRHDFLSLKIAGEKKKSGEVIYWWRNLLWKLMSFACKSVTFKAYIP